MFEFQLIVLTVNVAVKADGVQDGSMQMVE